MHNEILGAHGVPSTGVRGYPAPQRAPDVPVGNGLLRKSWASACYRRRKAKIMCSEV